MIVQLITLICGLLFLFFGGSLVVKRLADISEKYYIREFWAGVLILAAITSLPEFLVGITSSIAGIPSLSLGNIIGSNFADVGLIFPLAVLLAGKINLKEIPKKRMILLGLLGMLPIIFGIDGRISRMDGFFLLLAFLFYLKWMSHNRNNEIREKKKSKTDFPGLILGFILLLLGVYFVVTSSSAIANLFNIPPILIGILGVALGTSLPELVVEIHSIKLKHWGLALGDLLGSIVLNSTLILGIVAILTPINYEFRSFIFASLGFIFSFIVFLFLLKKNEIGRKQILFLLLSYIFFYALEVVAESFL